MLSNLFKEKDRMMRATLFASVKVFLLGLLFCTVAFIIIYFFAAKGQWAIGTTFDAWYSNLTGVQPVNGKFSATNINGCWNCDIFAKLFDLMNVVGLEIYVMISDIVWTLVIFGFAVWLLRHIYKNVISEQNGDTSSFLTDVWKRIFMIGIVSAGIAYLSPTELKSMANTIFENTAVPVLKMGVGIGTEIIKSPICEKLEYPKTEVDGIISSELKNDILCLNNSINIVFLSATTAGANMVRFAINNFFNNPLAIIDIIAGMLITVIFFIMYITIPFVFIDIIFTIGILIALTPFMIAGYAFEETKSFSSKGINSLFGMAFYIIVYCIFIGILYASFVYIADMYYPAPLDNFTYLFPDFIYNDIVASKTDTIVKSQFFKECFDSAKNITGLNSCLLKHNMELSQFDIQNSGGSFLSMFTLGLLSLMIMGSMSTYTGMVSGYMFKVGDQLLGFVKSTLKWSLSVARNKANTLLEKPLDPNVKKDKLSKTIDNVLTTSKEMDK